MRNEKKRHHYTSVTYLNGFVDDTGRVLAYRQDDPTEPLHIRPDEIALERYYYSQPLPDGGRDNNKLEDFFGTIENTWPQLVSVLKSGTSINVSDFEALCTFMTMMRVRVPATRDLVELSLAEQVKATVRLRDELGRGPPKPEGREDILDHMTVVIDPHQSLHAMPSLAQGFGVILDQLSFEVLHNQTDVSFLTSDNPVMYFDPTMSEGSVLPYQVRPPWGSIELLFPIDPQTALRGHSGFGPLRHVSLTDRKAVKRINRFTVRFGYRFVFADNRGHNALIVKYADTSPVLRSATVPGPEGRKLVYSEWVFGPRRKKPKWTG